MPQLKSKKLWDENMNIGQMEKYLRDLEQITGITGTFLISYPDGKVLATTLVADLKEKIIMEIFNVEATFQQFSNFLEMGNLKDYVLEGPNGIIIISKISKEGVEQTLTFIGIGGEDLNLPLIRIALLDFYKKIRALM